jgi:hypothetical protein
MDKKSHFLDESCQSLVGKFSFGAANLEIHRKKKQSGPLRPALLNFFEFALSNFYSGLLDEVQAPPVALKNSTRFWSEQNVRVPVVPAPEGLALLV